MTSRLVVFISGNGSNLQAILNACESGELDAVVVSVISNKAEAHGLTRALNAGIEGIHFAKVENESRNEYDLRLANYVATKQPDYIILAGWMRILTSNFLDHFPNRIINIHPALPDTFPGTHAIERAYDAYQSGEIKHTGVMIHLVPDEGVDNGPLLATEIVPIHQTDTLESLEERVHEVEHELLVKTINEWIFSQTTWKSFEDGQTIGSIGPEEGIIVFDEFHEYGARITLEKDGVTAPWAITCGGGFVHTVFFKTREQAEKAYLFMKFDLWKIFQIANEKEEEFYLSVKEFVKKH
ncbi:MAG: phosphoribosylglycinamide formyltransferase [Anaerolineales bacterium]|nr:phosphoribosylglycinamide formyltransferase [Anaerolineales bacterium]